MSGVYSMSSGPTYAGASRQALFDSAMDQPLSLTSTLVDQAKGGILETFGLGTAIKDLTTPQGNEAPSLAEPAFGMAAIPIPGAYSLLKSGVQALTDQGQPLTEDAYKGSASYRKDIPWDQGMTDTRAAALAASNDAKKVREYYATKRPFAAFIGNLAGQATDPVNYVPVFGEMVQAAAVGRFGYVAGRAMVAGADAALNTGIAGLATSGERAKFGDDVSWQALISQMATAGLIGSAFGTLHGVFGSRVDARAVSEAESRLATLRTTQEARIALNEGIDAIANAEDIKLSPNATEPMARVAGEIQSRSFYRGMSQTEADSIANGSFEFQPGQLGIFVSPDRNVSEGFAKTGKTAENTVQEIRVRKDAKIISREDALYKESEAAATLQSTGGKGTYISQKALRDELVKRGVDGVEGVSANGYKETQIVNTAAILRDKGVVTNPAGEKFLVGAGEVPKKGLVAANQYGDGRVYIGKPGEPHFAVNELATGDGEPTLMGFMTPDGMLLDRQEALAWVNANEKQIRPSENMNGELDALDYREQVPEAMKRGAPQRTRAAIDTTVARPDLPPEGIKQAEASIAKPDDSKALASQYRVDPKTGSFHEEGEVAQLAAEGRLTEEDAATMVQAQADYETGAAYAEALKSVAGCLL